MALALAALAPSALPGPSSLPSDVPSFLLAAAKEEKSQHACGAWTMGEADATPNAPRLTMVKVPAT